MPEEIDYDRLRESLRRRSTGRSSRTAPRAGADPARVADLRSSLFGGGDSGGGKGGRGIFEQVVDTALDTGKGIVTGLPNAIWDSTVGNVAGVIATGKGRTAEDIRSGGGVLGGLRRALVNEEFMESAERGDSALTQFAEAAPILGEPARSAKETARRFGELGEVALTGKGIEDTAYGQASEDSQIVATLFEDLGNVLLGVAGAGGVAGAAKGARAGAAARGARGAVSGLRAGARRGETSGLPGVATRVDDAIGRAVLSPVIYGPRLARGAIRRGAQTSVGQALGNSRIGNAARSRLITGGDDAAMVRAEMDLGNKINATRRGAEALGPADQIYRILSGEARGVKRKQRRSMAEVDTLQAAAVLDMLGAADALPVELLDRLRSESPDGYAEVVSKLGESFADDLTVEAMDTFIDYKTGRLPDEVAGDIAAAQQVWRDQALYSEGTADVLGTEVPLGAEQNFVEGTGRIDAEKVGGQDWRERSLLAEVLPDNLTPIERQAARGRKRLERGVEQAAADVERLGARRRLSDAALADPVGAAETTFARATAEARRLVGTNPDVVADVQARLSRPLSQEGLVRAVRNEILDRRRQLDGLDEVPNTPLFQAAATLDRPVFTPRRDAFAGVVREAGREGAAQRARRSERWNTGRMEQNAARAEQIRAGRAPVSVSKKVLNRVAATARAEQRAKDRLAASNKALRKVEAKLAEVRDNDRPAIRQQIRAFRREVRAQLEADRDATVAALTDRLMEATGGDSIVVRSADEVADIEAALRGAGVAVDWKRLQFPGTTKRVFRVDLTPEGQGRISGAVAADRLGVDVAALTSEILVPLQEARSISFAGIVDDGIDYGQSWLAASEAEAHLLVGPVDEAVDAWVQAEGNPAAAAREDAMWDEAVERMQQVYALRAAGEPIRAALDGATPDVRKAVHALLAEEQVRSAAGVLGARIDDAAGVLGEQGARLGRVQGRREGMAEGRAAQAREAAARDARVRGSDALPEAEAQAAARIGGSAVRQVAPELRLAGQQQRALRDLSRAERKLVTYDARTEKRLATAREMLTSAPARFRPMIELGRTADAILSEFDWSKYGVDPSLAGQLHAGVLTQVADALAKANPDHMRGGPTRLLTQTTGVAPSQGGGGKRVQAARTKATGRVPLSFSKQAALALRDIRQQATNETMFRVADQIGKPPEDVLVDIAADRGVSLESLEGMSGAELLAEAGRLYGGEWVGWNPMSLFPADHSGRTLGKFIDEADATTATVLAPRWVPEAFEYAASQDSAWAQALIDKPTRVFKGAVLALSPRWMVGNVVSGAIMLHAADVTMADVARHAREAYREIRAMGKGQQGGAIPRWAVDTGLTANEMALLNRLEVAAIDNIDFDEVAVTGQRGGRVRQAGGAVVRGGYALNTFVDNWYKSIAAMTKAEDRGWQRGSGPVPTEAVTEALAIMGDYDRMTPFERRVIRRLFPFYAWVRHITKLTHKVAVDDPARVLWNVHLANVFAPEDELWETVPWLRGAISTGDEYLNIGWLFPFDTTAQMDYTNPAAILGGNLNPVLGTAAGLITGIDTSFGEFEPLSRPGVRFGGDSPKPPLFSDPLGSAFLIGRNIPQFRGVWNEVQRRLNDGDPLRQYDTGQVKPTDLDPNRSGTNNLATILNVPLPRVYEVPRRR